MAQEFATTTPKIHGPGWEKGGWREFLFEAALTFACSLDQVKSAAYCRFRVTRTRMTRTAVNRRCGPASATTGLMRVRWSLDESSGTDGARHIWMSCSSGMTHDYFSEACIPAPRASWAPRGERSFRTAPVTNPDRDAHAAPVTQPTFDVVMRWPRRWLGQTISLLRPVPGSSGGCRGGCL
jgi:hypothetical protein